MGTCLSTPSILVLIERSGMTIRLSDDLSTLIVSCIPWLLHWRFEVLAYANQDNPSSFQLNFDCSVESRFRKFAQGEIDVTIYRLHSFTSRSGSGTGPRRH